LHQRGIHKGSKKRRDPNDPRMGIKIQAGRDSMVAKVKNKVALGRGEEHQVFSQNNYRKKIS
jgi:hypothetical protein